LGAGVLFFAHTIMLELLSQCGPPVGPAFLVRRSGGDRAPFRQRGVIFTF